uniref:Uncharacterized protein n=1 Tax=Pseudomonas phage RVTF4 TaxID=3236931 RepID=A0AB39CCL1_9VIRU
MSLSKGKRRYLVKIYSERARLRQFVRNIRMQWALDGDRPPRFPSLDQLQVYREMKKLEWDPIEFILKDESKNERYLVHHRGKHRNHEDPNGRMLHFNLDWSFAMENIEQTTQEEDHKRFLDYQEQLGKLTLADVPNLKPVRIPSISELERRHPGQLAEFTRFALAAQLAVRGGALDALVVKK